MNIPLKSMKHEEIMEFFERLYPHLRLDREESKELWAKGNIYQNGEANALFLAFRHGVTFGAAAL